MTISIADPTVYANDVNKPTDGQKLLTDLSTVFNQTNTIETGTFTFTGNKTFGGVVTIVTSPVSGTDAANKAYVDSRWIGVISLWGGSTLPTNALWCNAEAVSRTTYAALFAKIGTTWGVGDGSTTFNLPDGRDVVFAGLSTMGGVGPRGLLASALTLATQVGTEKHTMTAAELVQHKHKPSNNDRFTVGGGGTEVTNIIDPGASFGQVSYTGNAVSMDGGTEAAATPFSIMQPTTGVGVIIWYA